MMHTVDTEQYRTSICAMKSVDGNSVYVSFGKGAVSTSVFIGKEAAQELADSILEIVEELPDATDHSAQTALSFTEHQEAA